MASYHNFSVLCIHKKKWHFAAFKAVKMPSKEWVKMSWLKLKKKNVFQLFRHVKQKRKTSATQWIQTKGVAKKSISLRMPKFLDREPQNFTKNFFTDLENFLRIREVSDGIRNFFLEWNQFFKFSEGFCLYPQFFSGMRNFFKDSESFR